MIRQRQRSACAAYLWLALVLLAHGTARPRRLPTVPAELSSRDRSEILAILRADGAQPRWLHGWRARGRPELQAEIGLAGGRLAPGLDAVNEHSCSRREAGWQCWPRAKMVYARIPPACAAGRLQAEDDAVRFFPRDHFSIQQMRGVVALLCTDARLHEELWSRGRKPMSARWSDGQIWVRVSIPGTLDRGRLIVIDQSCRLRACEYRVAAIWGWVT